MRLLVPRKERMHVSALQAMTTCTAGIIRSERVQSSCAQQLRQQIKSHAGFCCQSDVMYVSFPGAPLTSCHTLVSRAFSQSSSKLCSLYNAIAASNVTVDDSSWS